MFDNIDPLDGMCLWFSFIAAITAYIPFVPLFIVAIWASILFFSAVQERSLRGYNDRSIGIEGKGRPKDEAA